MKDMARIRVFFVDNERILNCKWAIRYFMEGVQIVGWADKTRLALPKIRKRKPDIVVCDAILNGRKDGINFCTELRRESDIPVIMVTDILGEHFLGKVKPLKLADLILKPVDPPALLESIFEAAENPDREVDYKKFRL